MGERRAVLDDAELPAPGSTPQTATATCTPGPRPSARPASARAPHPSREQHEARCAASQPMRRGRRSREAGPHERAAGCGWRNPPAGMVARSPGGLSHAAASGCPSRRAVREREQWTAGSSQGRAPPDQAPGPDRQPSAEPRDQRSLPSSETSPAAVRRAPHVSHGQSGGSAGRGGGPRADGLARLRVTGPASRYS